MLYLIFCLDDQAFAIELQKVERIIWAVGIKKVPNLCEPLEGLIVIEEASIPVINVRHQLDLPSKELDIKDQFIICSHKGHRAALWVDYVDKILDDNEASELSDEIRAEGPDVWRPFIHDGTQVILIYDCDEYAKKLEESKEPV